MSSSNVPHTTPSSLEHRIANVYWQQSRALIDLLADRLSDQHLHEPVSGHALALQQGVMVSLKRIVRTIHAVAHSSLSEQEFRRVMMETESAAQFFHSQVHLVQSTISSFQSHELIAGISEVRTRHLTLRIPKDVVCCL